MHACMYMDFVPEINLFVFVFLQQIHYQEPISYLCKHASTVVGL